MRELPDTKQELEDKKHIIDLNTEDGEKTGVNLTCVYLC